jgi:hypothetical protein
MLPNDSSKKVGRIVGDEPRLRLFFERAKEVVGNLHCSHSASSRSLNTINEQYLR